MDNLIVSISFFVVIIFTTFSIILLSKRTPLYSENKLFASFLLINVLLIICSYLFKNGIFDSYKFYFIYFMNVAAFYLLGPLLYLYFLKCTTKNKPLSYKTFVHFLPYFIILFYLSLDYIIRKSNTPVSQHAYLWSNMSYHIYLALLNIQIFIYLIMTFRIVLKYVENYKQNYSEVSKIRVSWFVIILITFTVHWILDILTAYSYFWFRSWTSVFESFSLTGLVAFATVIVYRGLQSETIFFENNNKEKYIGSPISEDEKMVYLNRLSGFMENNKPYLSPKLTLNQLAESIDVSPRYLSQIINEKFNCNFFDYVNRYRINEAKSKLEATDLNNGQTTILEILFEVGFNSKTAFNRAFKKQIGVTPTEFRKSPTI